jgi:transcriptional regulator with XRE-family HTH domain
MALDTGSHDSLRGTVLRLRRIACRLGAHVLAVRIGVAEDLLEAWERGRPIPGAVLPNLLRWLGWTPEQLEAAVAARARRHRNRQSRARLPPGGEWTADESLELAVKVGLLLRERRDRLGLDQKTVARRAGITGAMASSYERGWQLPSLRSLVRLAGVLGIGLGDLDPLLRRGARPGTEGGTAPRGA